MKLYSVLIFVMCSLLALDSFNRVETLPRKRSKTILLDEIPQDLRLSLRGAGSSQEAAKIRKYLDKAVETRAEDEDGDGDGDGDDAVASRSIEEATRLLAKLSSNERQCDDALIQALEMFVQLPGTVEKCDYQGYIELATNYLLIGGGELGESHRLVKDKLTQTVLHYGLKHREHCLAKYGPAYKELIEASVAEQHLSDLLNSVENLFDDQLIGDLVKPTGADLISVPMEEFKILDESVLGKLVAKFQLISSLDSLLKVSEHPMIRWDKVHEVVKLRWVERNLQKQCSDFTWFFKDIFSPARLDTLLNAGSLDDASGPTLDERFFKHWRIYRACTAFQRASTTELAEGIVDILFDKQQSNN